jgi:biofilm PGA synthesis protein PgaD
MNDTEMPELIIYRPHREPPAQRYVSRALTVVAWSLYLYLWLPLMTLAAWWLSLRFGIEQLRLADAPPVIDRGPFAMLGIVALSAIVVFIGWAEYNRLRYGRRERRRAVPPVTLDESAIALGVAPELAAQLRAVRVATVALNERAAAIGIVPAAGKSAADSA